MESAEPKPQRLTAEQVATIASGASAEVDMILDHLTAVEAELTQEREAAELLKQLVEAGGADRKRLAEVVSSLCHVFPGGHPVHTKMVDDGLGCGEMAVHLAWEATKLLKPFATIAEERIAYLWLHGSLPVPREIGLSGALDGWWMEFCPDKSFIICPAGLESMLWAWKANHFPTQGHREEYDNIVLNHWGTTIKHEAAVGPGWQPNRG